MLKHNKKLPRMKNKKFVTVINFIFSWSTMHLEGITIWERMALEQSTEQSWKLVVNWPI